MNPFDPTDHLPQERYTIPPEMVPISGLNSQFKCVSGARQAMFTGNLSQVLIVDGRTRKRQQTGLEREIAKATFNHQFPREAVVLAIIPRFTSRNFGDKFQINPFDLVIYEDWETKELDVVELSKFHVMHQHYGFEFEYDQDVYDAIVKGKRFKAGTVIARSPAVTDDGDYMYGLETNVCMISDPAGTEDGVKISQSYAKRIRSTGFESRIARFGGSHYPINWNGNLEEYKPIPDIGDFIQSNGLICASRPFDPKYDPVYMTRTKLLKPQYGLDTPLYGVPNAQVVDIRVLHNDRLSSPKLPKEMTKQFLKYYEADQEFYTKIVKTCLCRKGNFLADDVAMSPRLRILLYEAIARSGERLLEEGIWPKSKADQLRVRTKYRGEILDEFRVEIIYQYKTSVGEGPKVTDQSGGKGVTSAVAPDEDMPTDENGIRADVVIFSNSTVNRLNNGRQHTQVIGAAGRDIIKRVRKSYGLPAFGPIDREEVKRAVTSQNNMAVTMKNFAYIIGFYKLVAPAMYERLTRNDIIPQGIHLQHVIECIMDGEDPHGLFLQLASSDEVYMDKVIKEIEAGPYMPDLTPVTYRNLAGEMVTTKTKILIGPDYYLPLEKTATDGSGVSSSKTNHFGVTARLTNADKYASPGRETVTKSTGESEARNHAHAYGAEPLAHIMDLNYNPVVHKEACMTILTHETPTNIECLVDREKFKLGGHRPLAYVRHMMAVSGKNISRE